MRRDHTRMRLGKQAPRHDPRTLLFATYFRGDDAPASARVRGLGLARQELANDGQRSDR